MTPKAWYQSKTIWFNTLTFVVIVATFFGYTPNSEVAETTSAILIALSPVVNLILRAITKEPIQ